MHVNFKWNSKLISKVFVYCGKFNNVVQIERLTELIINFIIILKVSHCLTLQVELITI